MRKSSCRNTGVLHVEARPAVATKAIEGAGAQNTWRKVRKEKGEKAYLIEGGWSQASLGNAQ